MSDHEYIWLEPQCCADKGDRHWCEDNVYDQDNSFESLCDCLNPVHATKYIRIDLHDAEVKRLEKELGIQQALNNQQSELLNTQVYRAESAEAKLEKINVLVMDYEDEIKVKNRAESVLRQVVTEIKTALSDTQENGDEKT